MVSRFKTKFPVWQFYDTVTMSLLKRFWPYMKPYRRTIIFVALLMCIELPLSAALPLLVKYQLDTVTVSGDVRELIAIGAILILLVVIAQSANICQTIFNKRFHLQVLHRVRQHLFSHLLKLPIGFYIQHDTGYLMSRQRDDINNLNSVMANVYLDILFSFLRILVAAGFLFYLDPVLTTGSLVVMGTFASFNLVIARPLRHRSQAVQEADANTATQLHEAITGIRLIKTAVLEQFELQKYVHSLNDYLKRAFKRDRLEILFKQSMSMADAIGTYLIITIGAYRIITGATTFGNLFAYFLYLGGLFMAASNLRRINIDMQRGLASLQRIFELFDTPAENYTTNKSTLNTANHEITFDAVDFGYLPKTPVLKGISVTIAPNTQVALVGPSGAGKTTFAHLIPRFFDPNSGQILLNGKDIRDWELHGLRKRIGIVPQDVFLFNRTILENIAYGNTAISQAEIETAARHANAHEFILQLPNGYQTRIGERGIRLSEGQKQRIAIAREILRNPPILILDEATSSLDSESEALIQEALQRLKKNRTSIIIAHRLSTVVEADWILVFDGGRIVEQGTHEELMVCNGLYAALFRKQFHLFV